MRNAARQPAPRGLAVWGSEPACRRQATLSRYIELRRKESAANGTINRELSLLQRSFVLGYESQPRKIAHPLRFHRLAESKPRQGFIEQKQFDWPRIAPICLCGPCCCHWPTWPTDDSEDAGVGAVDSRQFGCASCNQSHFPFLPNLPKSLLFFRKMSVALFRSNVASVAILRRFDPSSSSRSEAREASDVGFEIRYLLRCNTRSATYPYLVR
jgi:hypothetical protein